MAKYWVSGSNTVLLGSTFHTTSIPGTGCPGDPTVLIMGQNVLSTGITSGRVFWLRSFWAHDASAGILLHLYDATVGADATGSTRKALIQCASGQLTMVDFPSPGLKFSTGCVVARDTTAGATTIFPIGSVGGAGYEV